MKLVAEPPPTLQPLGYATKFVADPPPTLQPVYLFGKVISPVVRLMSTWKAAPPPVPASVPPPADGEPHPLHWKATTASRSVWIARVRAVAQGTRERERERKRKGSGTMLRGSFARQPGAHQACAVVLRATGAALRAPPRITGCFSPPGRASIPGDEDQPSAHRRLPAPQPLDGGDGDDGRLHRHAHRGRRPRRDPPLLVGLHRVPAHLDGDGDRKSTRLN